MGMRFIAGLVMTLTGIYRLDEPQDAIIVDQPALPRTGKELARRASAYFGA
jgi:hypothetical protein